MNRYAVGDRDGKRHFIKADYCGDIAGSLKFYDSQDSCVAHFREAIYWIKLEEKGESNGS